MNPIPSSNEAFTVSGTRARNGSSVLVSMAWSRLNRGFIAASSTGRNSSASTDVGPRPSTDAISTFGGDTSNARTNVVSGFRADEISARMTYFPGGN